MPCILRRTPMELRRRLISSKPVSPIPLERSIFVLASDIRAVRSTEHSRQGKSGLELSCRANNFRMRLLSRPDNVLPMNTGLKRSRLVDTTPRRAPVPTPPHGYGGGRTPTLEAPCGASGR